MNAVAADGKFNQVVVRRALDQRNKGVFESPIPLRVTFKDAKKFDIQSPVIENLLSQVNANKVSDAKVKQLLGQAKELIKVTITIILQILMIAMLMIMIIMTVERNNVEDTIILED